MPRHPHFAPSIAAIRDSVFSNLAHRIANHRGQVFPFHVGDTWLEPPEGCRMEDLRVDDHPGLHRYSPPRGLPRLAQAVAERLSARTGVATEPGDVLITAGATGALGAITRAVLEPGDEVLILTPYWPLITGIVACAGAVPVTVPFVGSADSPESAVDLVRRRRTPRTAALYLSTPNNPTGFVIPEAWISALVEWAGRENLWIITDEVYEDYVYTGAHAYARALAPERTFSAHSFSKAFGMAGNRCGFVAGPRSAMNYLCKVSTHSFYSTPTASQLAACRALDGRGDAWVARVREQYRETGAQAAARLGLPAPMGGTFLFVDVGSQLDTRGLSGFLEDCADRGLFLAPGPSFGDYPAHVRVCFTSAPPDVVATGVELLAKLLGR
jgi:aspartate/methionine/tyrosine aminotransferase